MKIVILTRYPRVDTPRWKRILAESLLEFGAELRIVYTRSAAADQLGAGFKEFGWDVMKRYGEARAAAPDDDGRADTLAAWAKTRGIPVARYRRIGDPGLLAALEADPPDLVVLAGADIVPRSVLAVPRLGTLNPHYGLLPVYRGMNVAEWSIFCDDPVAVTVHLVDAGIDTGDIVLREPISIERGETLEHVRAKQQALAATMLRQAVGLLAAGEADRVSQTAAEGRQYYRMHPLVKARVEAKLSAGTYLWTGRVATMADLAAAVARRRR